MRIPVKRVDRRDCVSGGLPLDRIRHRSRSATQSAPPAPALVFSQLDVRLASKRSQTTMPTAMAST